MASVICVFSFTAYELEEMLSSVLLLAFFKFFVLWLDNGHAYSFLLIFFFFASISNFDTKVSIHSIWILQKSEVLPNLLVYVFKKLF